MIIRILICSSLLVSVNLEACDVGRLSPEEIKAYIATTALESSAVSVAEVSRLSKIRFGGKRGYYKVTFTIKDSWSRNSLGRLEKINLKNKITMLDYVGDGSCFSLSVNTGGIYWLFSKEGEYVAHHDIISLNPREIEGFRTENH